MYHHKIQFYQTILILFYKGQISKSYSDMFEHTNFKAITWRIEQCWFTVLKDTTFWVLKCSFYRCVPDHHQKYERVNRQFALLDHLCRSKPHNICTKRDHICCTYHVQVQYTFIYVKLTISINCHSSDLTTIS